jgi:hypothetical protein
MKTLLLLVLITSLTYVFLSNFIIGAICTIPAVMVYTLLTDLVDDFKGAL